MIKYCILSLLFIIITMPFSLFAQNDEIDESYFLDINEAKEAIARLEKNNEENTKRINDLENQNKQMTEENNQNKAKLESANDLIEKCKQNSYVLYEQSLTIIDKEGQQKATDAYEDNKQTLTKLYAKKKELEKNINSNERQIATNTQEVYLLNNRIKMNNQEISELQNSIDKTLSKINEIENQIDNTTKLKEEVERLFD